MVDQEVVWLSRRVGKKERVDDVGPTGPLSCNSGPAISS